jgi:glycosyltransferase involved in cell wall biosynthesis
MQKAQEMQHARLSVIVPAYNEENTLGDVIRKLLEIPQLLEVIIVDDCSTDATLTVARGFEAAHAAVRVLHHGRNQGKTAALKTGFAAAAGEVILVQDADLEYDPAEIPALVEPILCGRADVVYGSRFLVRKAARVLYFYHYLANRMLTFLSNLFTNVNMTDVETGYKAFRREIIQNMVITSSGFGFEIEVTAKISKLECAIYEVPISYHGRTYQEGKKIGFSDGVQAVWLIVWYNLFCPLKRSFRAVPELQRGLVRNAVSHEMGWRSAER